MAAQKLFCVKNIVDLFVFQEPIGVYVGTEGDLKVNMAGEGEGIIFADLAAGVWHPLCVTRIYDGDTTADDILIAW